MTTEVSSQTQLSYETAVAKAMGLADFERGSHSPSHSSFHLERISLLLERLGNPHLETPTIHVAGTKGKGSTSAMVTSILTTAGYKTGLYTSPSLHTITERIRVGLDPIGKEIFAGLVNYVWPAVQWVGTQHRFGEITYFELITAMAFTHFKNIRADFQVIEVGLGGRLDATNVVTPTVSVITNISLDHTSVLGNTLPEIASEKAGIIKPGIPVVIAPQTSNVMPVLEKTAANKNAPMILIDHPLSYAEQASLEGQHLRIQGKLDNYDLVLNLLGRYQQDNAATAAATAEILATNGYRITTKDITDGLSQVRWPGRMQLLKRDGPIVLVDGAHNPYSMRLLVKSIKESIEASQVIVIFGSTGGHNTADMAAELAALNPIVIATQSRHPKAIAVKQVTNIIRDTGLEYIEQCGGVSVATNLALSTAHKNDLIVGTGSLAVVAEVIEEIEKRKPELYPPFRGVIKA